MRNDDLDARGEAGDGAAAANGVAVVGRKRGKRTTRRTRRSWDVEEKTRIARESFASSETITAVAQRHGITRRLLSSWRWRGRHDGLVGRYTDRGGHTEAVDFRKGHDGLAAVVQNELGLAARGKSPPGEVRG